MTASVVMCSATRGADGMNNMGLMFCLTVIGVLFGVYVGYMIGKTGNDSNDDWPRYA